MKRNKSFEVKAMETRSPLSLQGMKKYSIISAVRKNEPLSKKRKTEEEERKRRSNMENPSSPKERKNKRR